MTVFYVLCLQRTARHPQAYDTNLVHLFRPLLKTVLVRLQNLGKTVQVSGLQRRSTALWKSRGNPRRARGFARSY